MPLDACLAEAQARHAIEVSDHVTWSANDAAAGTALLLAVADDDVRRRSQALAERNRDADPAELLDVIERLLAPDGIFAAISR